MAAWIKMPLGVEVGLTPGDFVLDVDPAHPSPKREQSPQIFGHVYVAKRMDGSRWYLTWRYASAQTTLC